MEQPSAQTALFNLLYHHKLLNQPNTTLLTDLMEQTYVAPKRMRGLLPAGTVVAHRTGTSSTNAEGLSPATNDVGVITLPDGRHLAVAIFLMDSHADIAVREEIIARVARAAYDEFAVR